MTTQTKKPFDFKLYFALLMSLFIPTIYTTVRIFFIGSLPSAKAFSIAGQLGWINLIYEVFEEAIILPLFYFIGQVIHDKAKLTGRIKSGLTVSAIVYTILSVAIIIFVHPLLRLMATGSEITDASAVYIRIESVGNIFALMFSFLMVVFTTIGKEKYLYTLLIAKMLLSILIDTFLVSTLPFSANLGVNGIGFSNIISNILLLIVALLILKKEGIRIFGKEKADYSWIGELGKVGGISGLESLVRNLFYMLMVCRMVNVVGEQGTYWVANKFIWSWLLLPINALGELIKKELASDKNAIIEKTKQYFIATFIICAVWFVTIPVWKPFMQNILRFNEVEKLFSLVLILIGFYVAYALQNIFDMTFYGLGKTEYMLWETVVTNVTYYGTFFVLFKTGIFVPTLTKIAIMFGAGCAYDAIVSGAAYLILRKRMGIMGRESKN